MIKIYAVVGIMCSIVATSASANQTLNLSTAELIRAKLWYEGIQPTQPMEQEKDSVSNLNYPEELTVALELIEPEKNRR